MFCTGPSVVNRSTGRSMVRGENLGQCLAIDVVGAAGRGRADAELIRPVGARRRAPAPRKRRARRQGAQTLSNIVFMVSLPYGPNALVSRFRSSHHCAAASFANFGIEGH
jgi:hypothetical protein